jgi:hypothetical protein
MAWLGRPLASYPLAGTCRTCPGKHCVQDSEPAHTETCPRHSLCSCLPCCQKTSPRGSPGPMGHAHTRTHARTHIQRSGSATQRERMCQCRVVPTLPSTPWPTAQDMVYPREYVPPAQSMQLVDASTLFHWPAGQSVQAPGSTQGGASRSRRHSQDSGVPTTSSTHVPLPAPLYLPGAQAWQYSRHPDGS